MERSESSANPPWRRIGGGLAERISKLVIIPNLEIFRADFIFAHNEKQLWQAWRTQYDNFRFWKGRYSMFCARVFQLIEQINYSGAEYFCF